ncbi:hypothetical protein ACLKA6_016388 [Drosophila palustris]
MRTRVQTETETGKSESESKSMLESRLQSKMAVDHPHTVYSASSPPAQCQIDNNNNNNNNLSVAWCAGVTGRTDRQTVSQAITNAATSHSQSPCPVWQGRLVCGQPVPVLSGSAVLRPCARITNPESRPGAAQAAASYYELRLQEQQSISVPFFNCIQATRQMPLRRRRRNSN